MTTQTPDKPQEEATEQAFQLAPRRKAVEKGMLTKGLMIFAGLPKSGKTTLAASMPDAVLLELERGGADRVDGWVQNIADLETVRRAMKACVENPQVKTIVIDTLDVLYDWFDYENAGQFGLENSSERREGVNGFEVQKALRATVERFMDYCRDSDKIVCLLAHNREPKIDGEGKVVTPAGINVPGKIGSYIAGAVDLIGHCYKSQSGSTTKYYVSFRGGPLGTWGSRVKELEDKIIELPAVEQWQAIVDVCNGKAAAKAPEPVKTDKTGKNKGGK